ncbi:8-oxo-dGTP diphosphatase MutT [Shewanella sp. D64]|uniref:8-oxo-dGTP diphosphatase MutT n=1 Tax=unclassified Shewanella TaxID=196818 RepID=UPI0022BA3B59|nr:MULTISPECIES: 8-oxo-dGTP diphosphatase MutT [unclassified Shewanella]MEC4728387.1 8-oxo-dGTP diphosphatase MutT [Shewanella sp. D64]MEC4740420.1 8-oxo-dGTP diphosphatase MutT [Shewanella sp. E94]WBJ95064.1 8-oxo-dGTP diphosphatase MutT [Shewanella sp. MTB7]
MPELAVKRVHVAVGVIINYNQEVLLAKRPQHLHQGGKWEFPGGKVEQGETVTEALIRELKEEVNLDVSATTPLMQISHDYSDKQVLLDIHLVSHFDGEAKGLEDQEICWVAKENLVNYDFPEANKPIIDRILAH